MCLVSLADLTPAQSVSAVLDMFMRLLDDEDHSVRISAGYVICMSNDVHEIYSLFSSVQVLGPKVVMMLGMPKLNFVA